MANSVIVAMCDARNYLPKEEATLFLGKWFLGTIYEIKNLPTRG